MKQRILFCSYIYFIYFLFSHGTITCLTQDQETNILIKTFLDQYTRPFTMIQIGTKKPYCLQMAPHFKDSVFVMLENDTYAKQIYKQLCKQSPNNIILLKRKIKSRNLKRLSECEHFDVILLDTISQQFGNKWKKIIDHTLHMGDHIIIKVKPEEQTILEYVKNKNMIPIAQSNNATFYFLTTAKQYLQRINWIFPNIHTDKYYIKSNFQKKELHKKEAEDREVSQWLPGINLITFKMCKGLYPEKHSLKTSIKKLKNLEHNDWEAHNMIVQGNTASLIDFENKRSRKYTEKRLRNVLQLIGIDDLTDLSIVFLRHLLF